MSVKIRLQRRGRKKLPLYHIVIADSRSPRDGRFIENIGSYNPLTRPATIEIDRDKAFDWLMKGAEPTDTVRAILKFKGVMYRKHLNRGVTKGAMTQEEADAKYMAWVDEKEAKIAKRAKATSDEISAYHAKRSGAAKAKPKKEEEPVVETEAAEAPTAEEVQPVEETQPVAEAQTEESTESAASSEASPEEKTAE
jgi:small subunit ribosomal protein S16